MNSLRSVRPIPAGTTKIEFLYTWGVDTVCYLTLSIMASYPIYSHNIDFKGVHELAALGSVRQYQPLQARLVTPVGRALPSVGSVTESPQTTLGLANGYSHQIHFNGVHECFAFPGVTPAHKGLYSYHVNFKGTHENALLCSPSGLLCKCFFQRTLSNLPFKAHTRVWQKWRFSAPQTHLWLIKVWFTASTFVVKIATFAKPETIMHKRKKDNDTAK
jgi:hypothetical protein